MTCLGLSLHVLEMLFDQSLLIHPQSGSLSHLSMSHHPFIRELTSLRDSDKGAKVIDLQDIKKIVLLEGHSRGARREIWHPSGTLLVRSRYSSVTPSYL